jgi:16S rRNA (uracil1498-N3)-methyltransferase
VSRTPRIYCPELPPEGGTALLDEAASRHLTRVLRLGPGAPLRLFDGRGREHDARLEGGGQKAAKASVLAARTPAPESPLPLLLLQGVGRGERMDFAVQKATELGVTAVWPVLTARSVVRLDGDRAARRQAHWRSVAVGACEQCGRAVVPEIGAPGGLAGALAAVPRGYDRLLPDPGAAHALTALPRPEGGLAILIGPEGGLDEAERREAAAAGFRTVRLGPRILRTETAALAAVAIAQALWGDLGR